MTTINDGIVSLASSLGQRSTDRTYIAGRRLTDKQLTDMYENNWIVRKYVDVRTTDMTRLDREILTPDFDNKAFESAGRRTGAFSAKESCLSWCSLYGDALILAITDEEDLAKPYEETETLRRFIALDKTAYDFDDVEDDIANANFGKPRMYRINGDILVHNSRLCRIQTSKRSFKDVTSTRKKYSASDIQAIKDPLFNYLTVCANIFDIVDQSKTDVIYVENFDNGIRSGREDDYKELALAMKSIRSSTDTLFLDKTATWEQKELTFTGLTDIMAKARDDLAGGLCMPLTKLFGQSAAGFASGVEDAQNYNQDIASLQESRCRPLDLFIDKFLLKDIQSNADMLDFVYPSIELVNETEKSTILTNTINALNTALQSGIIDEAKFAEELRNSDLVNFTNEEIETLREMISEPTESYQTAQIESGEAEQASRGILPQAVNLASGLNAITGNQ